MAIDDVPEQEVLPIEPPENAGHTAKFVAVFLILAALAVGEIYTLSKVRSMRVSLDAQQAQTRQELNAQVQQQLSTRLGALERSNGRQLEALKDELESAAKHMGSTGRELRRARTMVAKLQQAQQEQQVQADSLRKEIGRKADQQQLGTLTQDVDAQRSDLESTKKTVGVLTADLGMARSEMGTLIARNHEDIEYLRKLGERDYFEFTLDRNQPARVANLGLALKKTNAKRHRFSLTLVVDDMEVEKKDRTINEPVFFYVHGSKKPYELVVNSVESHQLKGYISTPKGTIEVAAHSEAAR